MTDDYRPIFERLDAALALIQANEQAMAAHLAIHQALQRVWTDIAKATQQARDEQDIRERVHRLEGLVTELLRRQNGGDA